MTTGNRVDLAAIEQFAKTVTEGTTGIFYSPHAMAQSMLALIERVRESDWMRQQRLRQFDRLTLQVSLLLEEASDLSKKQLVQKLDGIYRGASEPS